MNIMLKTTQQHLLKLQLDAFRSDINLITRDVVARYILPDDIQIALVKANPRIITKLRHPCKEVKQYIKMLDVL